MGDQAAAQKNNLLLQESGEKRMQQAQPTSFDTSCVRAIKLSANQKREKMTKERLKCPGSEHTQYTRLHQFGVFFLGGGGGGGGRVVEVGRGGGG